MHGAKLSDLVSKRGGPISTSRHVNRFADSSDLSFVDLSRSICALQHRDQLRRINLFAKES